MGNTTSRFDIPNPFWYEDLPARSASLEESRDAAIQEEDLLSINQDHLDISRMSSLLRGGFIFLGLLSLAFLGWFAPFIFSTIFSPPSSAALIVIVATMYVAQVGYSLFMIWLDCHIPRDLPVRFDRRAGKIYVQDYSLSLNPFRRRRLEFKTFDWTGVEAELSRQAGFNGKAYMVRYALVLVICKPGTREVVERLTLKGNDITVRGLQAMWNYIRRYMAEGAAGLPTVTPRCRALSLRRSLFTYMPYFDPSQEGADFRERMGVVDWLLALLVMGFFWVWLPLGLCHYIAMRLAPEACWPDLLSPQPTMPAVTK